MARKSYINRQRKLADQAAAALEGPGTPPAPAAVPELLARAVALVTRYPRAAFWESARIEVASHYDLFRIYRPGIIRSGDVDLVVLYQPGVSPTSFPVATRVGDEYKPMTDIAGFEQWLKLQGVS